MSEMAAAIGEDADAAEYAALSADDPRRLHRQARRRPTAPSTATARPAYAMALGMDLVTGPGAARQGRPRSSSPSSRTSDYHLTTGFLGTPWLLPALSNIDRDDLAYTMLLHEGLPVVGLRGRANGATTMWERWNSIMPDGSFGDVDMNSFNHYAYGAVGDWMYQNIGGIKALEAGYKKIRIAPGRRRRTDPRLRATSTSVYGAIATDWSTARRRPLARRSRCRSTRPPRSCCRPPTRTPSPRAAPCSPTSTASPTWPPPTAPSPSPSGSGSYDFAVTSANACSGRSSTTSTPCRRTWATSPTSGDLAAGDARAHRRRPRRRHATTSAQRCWPRSTDDDATATSKLEAALDGIRDLRDLARRLGRRRPGPRRPRRPPGGDRGEAGHGR